MERKIITISDARLREAAAQGMDEFLQVFIDRYREVIGGELNAGNMGLLNGEQISLLAYALFREEVMDGGFIQLIHNGYGPFIFDNPFAKAMRLFGAKDFSKLLYEAKKIYDANRENLERDCTDDEFMAKYEKYEAFDDLEESYMDMEEIVTAKIAEYVDEHLDQFAKIVE